MIAQVLRVAEPVRPAIAKRRQPICDQSLRTRMHCRVRWAYHIGTPGHQVGL
jgi:hypothetical protein